MKSRVRQWIAMPGWLTVCGALLAVLLLMQITSLHHKGLTTDEPLHYEYGYRVFHGTLPLLAFSKVRRQATSSLQRGDARLKPTGQILMRLSISDFFGDCSDLLSFEAIN